MIVSRLHRALLVAAVGTASSLALAAQAAPEARACGCLAPPDPSVPIVQTGERILFSREDGVVTAHIQIQYDGPAEEFGWILPLPSVPEMAVGTDELFTQLIAQTQPQYRLIAQNTCEFGNSGGGGCSDCADAAAAPEPDAPAGGQDPLIVRDTVGPYEYAVLSAASKGEMLTWLTDNGYFVPANTDQVIDRYLGPGKYFLALKLRKNQTVGDLQPVVVKYESSLPMIPIVLTKVAANPDMGILVWMLGEHRAIPRNYYHTIINDAAIDWLRNGANYVDVITAAVDEAEGGPIESNASHQSFVTEYAGDSSVVWNLLDYQGRFGDPEQLKTLTDAVAYVEYLTGYGYFGPQFSPVVSSQLVSLLSRELPVPAAVTELGVLPAQYYFSMRYWVQRCQEGSTFTCADLDLEFDPVTLTADIVDRIVEPTRAAGALLRAHPYLTRLFTTLSPYEMTRDPVFSFNPQLPDISNVHQARLIYYCTSEADYLFETPAEIITEQGFHVWLPNGVQDDPWLDSYQPSMPRSRETQILGEEGAPEVVFDNAEEIDSYSQEDPPDDFPDPEGPGWQWPTGGSPTSGSGGCQLSPLGTGGATTVLMLIAAAVALAFRRSPRQ